jgi:UDP-glucose 4-epimerase
MKTVLITGGIGFIGSHATVECLEAGYDVIIIDDLSNATLDVLIRIETITSKKPTFYEGSILDSVLLGSIFKKHLIDAVIHFAAFKAVNESVIDPWKYLHNNVEGTFSMLSVMKQHQIKKMVFSSSATVYDDDQAPPFDETMRLGSKHAYGQSKIMVESMLSLLQEDLDSISLRYFNPVGAHPSGLIGESPVNQPNNLMPLINQVALGKRDKLEVYGSDYPTSDGTPERDYVHVVDVAKAHVLALQKLSSFQGAEVVNIGTGVPLTVMELIKSYEQVNNVKIPFEFTTRRLGDAASSYASIAKAKQFLNYAPTMSKEQMCKHAYLFVCNHRIDE